MSNSSILMIQIIRVFPTANAPHIAVCAQLGLFNHTVAVAGVTSAAKLLKLTEGFGVN